MRIKFTASLAGHNLSYTLGDIVDLPAAEAKRYVTAGFAVPSKAAETIETASLSEGSLEQATTPATLAVKHNPLPPKPKAVA